MTAAFHLNGNKFSIRSTFHPVFNEFGRMVKVKTCIYGSKGCYGKQVEAGDRKFQELMNDYTRWATGTKLEPSPLPEKSKPTIPPG
jgi:hypothetical protein